MIYGPMTRLIAENVNLVYATRCSVGYNFAAFFGSPMAGILATYLAWQRVFDLGSIMLIFMGAVCLATFTGFEKRGLITAKTYKKTTEKGGSVGVLIKRGIIRFTVVSIVTGVVRTTVVFWMPTYFADYLGYPPETATAIFTVATLIISLNAFISVSLYEALKRNMELTLFISFTVSAALFLLLYFVKIPLLSSAVLVLAVMASNCAASMIWSRYCPSLADTGRVSSATGFLDFVSYIAAAVSSTLFSRAVSSIGWGNLILIWSALMAVGVAVTIPRKIRNS
jgi:MFS family permease